MRDKLNITHEISKIERKIRRAEDRMCTLKGEYKGLMTALDLERRRQSRLKKEQRQIDEL